MDNIKFTKKEINLASKILKLSKTQISINFRFLSSALASLIYQASDKLKTIGTDGQKIYFNPNFIISQYSSSEHWLNRAHIHMILHCIYKHPFVSNFQKKHIWNLACEIAVDYTLSEFIHYSIPQENHFNKIKEINILKEKTGLFTAQNIYRVLVDYSPEKISYLQEVFIFDDHSYWDNNQGYNNIKNNENSGLESFLSDESIDAKQTSFESFVQTNSIVENNNLKEYWEKMSQSIEIDLQTFSKTQGNIPRSLLDSIKAVNRDKHDYTEFLKKFSVLKEEIKVDLDSFDYIYYTYGLTLYKNLPLIEPLEYKEVSKIYDFVIAIDTSGSVDNELIKQFLSKTYKILNSRESFHRKVNIRIIQCDTVIQEDKLITNENEFKEYVNNFVAKGRGGTDFRPLFNYVENLIEENMFHKLKGLLYFTDGAGTYPKKRPEYYVAFIFIKDEYYEEGVPPWAIKLILEKDDLSSQNN